MHRDAKLGLALGILVIGFAAAFCFPRHAGLPAHARAGEASTATTALDERLALRSVRVYTNARHPAESGEAAPPVLPAPALPVPPPGPSGDADAAITVDARYLAGPVGAGLNAGRPRARRESEEHSRGADPGKDVSADHDADQADPVDDAEPVGITHTVRPGETLSSIAQQHLGGSSRYSEVFELNRDLLASPDSLQIGMELKIPPKFRPRSPASDLGHSGPTQIADSQPDRRFGDRIETAPSRQETRSRQAETRPGAGLSVREPEPTPAEPFLPTTAIPAVGLQAAPATTPSVPAPARRGATSVGEILRNRRA